MTRKKKRKRKKKKKNKRSMLVILRVSIALFCTPGGGVLVDFPWRTRKERSSWTTETC